MTPSSPGKPDRKVLAAFLATVVLGGSNAVAIKIGNGELPPFWGATLRFGLATALLAVIALVARPPWPRGWWIETGPECEDNRQWSGEGSDS